MIRKEKKYKKTYKTTIEYDPNFDIYNLLEVDSDEDIIVIGEKVDMAVSMLENKCSQANDLSDLIDLEDKLMAVKNGWNIIRNAETREIYNALRDKYLNKHSDTAIKIEEIEDDEISKNAGSKGRLIIRTASAAVIVGAVLYCLLGCAKTDQIIDTETEVIETESQNNDTEEPTEEVDINCFTDPYNDEQVHARAVAIYECLVASNVNDISVESLENQIRFINGSYAATTDMDAYDMANEVLETFAEYGTALSQATNFAGDVVDENGVHSAINLSCFCVDNSEHAEFMKQASIYFVNLLTSETKEDKRNAAIEFLKQQSDLMLGLLVDETGTKLNYFSLDDNEGFVYGCMAQIAAPTIQFTLGSKYVIPYEGNLEQKTEVGTNQVFSYYNPQCNGEYDTENVWNQYLNELIVRSTLQKATNESLGLHN